MTTSTFAMAPSSPCLGRYMTRPSSVRTPLMRPLRLSRMTTSMRSPACCRNSALAYCLVPRIDTLSLVTCAQSPVPLWPPSVPPALTSAAPSLKVLELVQDGLSCVLIYFLFHTPSSIPPTALSYPSHFSLHHEPNDHALPCQPWTDAVCNDVACCFTRARAACYFRTDQCSSVTAVSVRLRIPV